MSDALRPRHASPRSRVLTVALPTGLAVTALGVLWALAEVPPAEVDALPPAPAAAAALPPVDLDSVTAADPCADPAVQDALAAGDDSTAIAAFGGGEAFRDAVVTGNAPCVSLQDPAHVWVVVNKSLPLEPAQYAPAALDETALAATSPSDQLHRDAASALEAMGQALSADGAGALGLNNGYRSYGLQDATYSGHVSSRGQEGADQVSARPGHSEHQTGLAVDVVACSDGCGAIGDFGGTPESTWVAEHAWEYGFIVRYEDGATGTTGYVPEPWHLRYIGPELAAAYQAGGYRSLEEFFGLPAAPDYPH